MEFPPSNSKITKIEWWDETLYESSLLSLNSPLRKIGSAIGKFGTLLANKEWKSSNW